jgi:putative endonuclease
MNWVYVLESLKDNNLYIGCTSDLKKRLKYHNSGKVRSTKTRRPLELIHSEEHVSITAARRRENFLKSGQGRKWIKENLLVRRDG